MAWIDKLMGPVEVNQVNRELDVERWLRSGGPSDPQKSPRRLRAEFCKYKPRWSGKEHQGPIETIIGMHQRAEAQRRENAAPAATENWATETISGTFTAAVDKRELFAPAIKRRVISTDPVEASIDDLLSSTEVRRSASDAIDRISSLADWIFSHHPTNGAPPSTKKQLEELARTSGAALGFVKSEFTSAFQTVYETTRYRPPKGGWSLREPFRSRLGQSKNSPQ